MTIFTWATIASWVLFCSYWILLRNKTSKNVRERTVRQRYLGPLGYVVIFGLLYLPLFVSGGFFGRILPSNALLQGIGATLCMAGIGICIWARTVLGRNWSGGVTEKHGHELVVKGPYRLVRHPIYSGFLTALAGTCMVTGGLAAMVITFIYTLALSRKLNSEEALLKDLFPGTYEVYQQQTQKLIPFIW
ncbi:protein-S-isoprenylcysteine O-methyltransferase [Chitinophaga dinghuensis]|uniref:Protein-S-isoprenylcysteine O-methyltransferase n=1 Tax=Chitinophaga dinghuensis TaxID=1539050 RepID=A0A327VTN6_9BACT|nr:isoprenylcysteine carboxylmethyltransferase family protein [Chitinophaga dinghuensis]RAJ77318.1 protein-S-isoprenylcysteine O-methyltransferase [Chitinophaga dinghuensis]